MPSADSSQELILDATSMRAIAHPVRIRIMGILRVDGPQNSTTLAERLGLNTGATSYHLRRLADHGMITEDIERGNARERWWTVPTRATRIIAAELDPEDLEEVAGFLRALALFHGEQTQRAVESYASEPVEWRTATTFSDYGLRLTSEEANGLISELREVLEKYRAYEKEDREEFDHFRVQIQAFRLDGY